MRLKTLLVLLPLLTGLPVLTAQAESCRSIYAPLPMESRQTRLRDRYLPQNPEMPRAYIKP